MKQTGCFLILLLLLAAPAVSLNGQQAETEETLSDLFSRILNTRDDDERVRLNDSIDLIIREYVSSDLVFTHRFGYIRYLGQILSPDSRVKIVTWNLILTGGTCRYYCYIIRKGEQGADNKTVRLTAVNSDEAPETGKTYSADDWYGALYYSIQPFRVGRDTYYAILGLDYGSLLVSRKIIDVLRFTEEGKVIFGMDCFEREGSLKYREVLEYHADGVMTLRFSDRKTILFDHLAPISSGRKFDQGYYGTEFSFDAYILKKGLWVFEKNFDAVNKH